MLYKHITIAIVTAFGTLSTAAPIANAEAAALALLHSREPEDLAASLPAFANTEQSHQGLCNLLPNAPQCHHHHGHKHSKQSHDHKSHHPGHGHKDHKPHKNGKDHRPHKNGKYHGPKKHHVDHKPQNHHNDHRLDTKRKGLCVLLPNLLSCGHHKDHNSKNHSGKNHNGKDHTQHKHHKGGKQNHHHEQHKSQNKGGSNSEHGHFQPSYFCSQPGQSCKMKRWAG